MSNKKRIQKKSELSEIKKRLSYLETENGHLRSEVARLKIKLTSDRMQENDLESILNPKRGGWKNVVKAMNSNADGFLFHPPVFGVPKQKEAMMGIEIQPDGSRKTVYAGSRDYKK